MADTIRMGRIILLLFLLSPAILALDPVQTTTESVKNQTRESRDTYLDAYKESHGSGSSSGFGEPPQKIQNKPSPSYAPVYAKPASSYLPSQTEKPSSQYLPSKPVTSYLPFKPDNTYLPSTKPGYPPSKPAPEYGAPLPQYLKPKPGHIETTDGYGYNNMNYPMDKPMYGIPHFHHHYQIPETEPETEVDKGHGGFDLKTVFKFLLKIVFIKKMIKLVYIVMYFLFMPKFSLLEMLASFLKDKDTEKEKPDSEEDKPSEEDEDNDMLEDEDDDSFFRSFSNINLNEIAENVAKALNNPPQ